LFSFCALGNFELKGLRPALEALSALSDQCANLLIIGGRNAEIAEYATIAARLGVEKQVRFVGLQTDIRPFLWASDAYLFPSAHETFPLVCLQAAAAGLPLLTPRLHGVEEFATNGETGWIIERTTASIVKAMRRALENRANLRRMGETARTRVSRYSVEKFQARWRDLIAELLRDR
jgi:glycosyltransferase involved in cell wall biosynthesis